MTITIKVLTILLLFTLIFTSVLVYLNTIGVQVQESIVQNVYDLIKTELVTMGGLKVFERVKASKPNAKAVMKQVQDLLKDKDVK